MLTTDFTPQELQGSTKIRLLYPWVLAIANGMLFYLCHRRGWGIPKDLKRFSLTTGLVALPALQLFLLMFISNEHISKNWFTELDLYFIVAHILIFLSILITFYTMWKSFRSSGREAIITAQEQQAREVKDRLAAVRAHRHDLINHIQILTAFTQENRHQEMVNYVERIKKEIV